MQPQADELEARHPVAGTAPLPAPTPAQVRPEGRPWRGRRRWLLIGFFSAVVLVVYQPLAMMNRLPRNVGDPAFVTWTLAWGARALTTNPLHWFDAPIFWPHHSTLAYSDPLILLAPLYAALHWVTGSWTVAVGLLVTALVALNLWATYTLAHRLTGRTDASVLAALVFGISDFALSQWGHIQLQVMGAIPLAFLLLLRVLDEGRFRDGLALGLLQAGMALTTASVALAWAVAATAALAVHGARGLVRLLRSRPGPVPARRVWRALIVAGAVCAALVVPLTRPYVQLQRDRSFRRPVSPAFHVTLSDFATPSRHRQFVSGIVPVVGRYTQEREYFPSATGLLLAAVGIAGLVWRRRRPHDEGAWRFGGDAAPVADLDGFAVPLDGRLDARLDARRHELWLITAAGVASLLVALGPDVAGLPGPYRLLHEQVPGFAGLRVASRFAVVTLLAVAVLAASGLTHVLARTGANLRKVIAGVAIAGVLFELGIPVKWKNLPTDHGTLAVYRALAARPAGAVLELPIADPSDGARWSTLEGPRMVYSTLDWHPRVNGYSGFVPARYGQDVEVLSDFPQPCAVLRARELGVRWVILHEGVRNHEPTLSTREVAQIVEALPDPAVVRFERSWLVDLDLVGVQAPPPGVSPCGRSARGAPDAPTAAASHGAAGAQGASRASPATAR